MSPPVSPHEEARLKALHSYHILDTPPETAFDRITALAARVFQVPIVLVSLIDKDRQWFKSCFGVDIRETSRELSFCAHAILRNEVMVVADARDDSRFCDHPMVVGSPHVRFYAGAPLQALSGHMLGTLCLIDTAPHTFSDEQRAQLADFAGIVVDELELRLSGRRLKEMMVAVNHLDSGVLILDTQREQMPVTFANSSFCAMTGYDQKEILGRDVRDLQEMGLSGAHTIFDAIEEKQPFKGVMVHHRKDGTPFHNEISIRPVRNETGEMTSVVVLQTDVSERIRAEKTLVQTKMATEQLNAELEERVQLRTRELADSQIEILARLARAAEFRDDNTGQHTQRVATLCALLAKQIGLPPEQITLIHQAAPLHDVGKIAIPDAILLKPGKLSEDEYAIMKSHASIGATLLSQGRSEAMQVGERIAASHHERWDGTGYPRQLVGDEIPLEGRILAIVDVFDALTHERPYKKAWTIEEATEEIRAQRGRQFDPTLVDAFLELPLQDLVASVSRAT